MSLIDLQRDFMRWLATGEASDAARLPLTDPAGRAVHGLGVYQNNYRGSLMVCLAESFPQTLLWLGEGAFEAAAACHIDRVPPSSWTLDDYALHFPDSLTRDYPQDHEVSDLARLELALGQSFIAEDAEALRSEQLAYVDWDGAMLRAVPSLTILSLCSNAEDIWAALADEADPPAALLVDMERPLLVWRHEWLCRFRPVEAEEAVMLTLLSEAPLSFADICAMAVTQWEEQEGIARIGQYLAQWCADGLVMLTRP